MESYNELKFKLIELVEFFYDNYKERKLTWFDPVFKEFEKLRKQSETKTH